MGELHNRRGWVKVWRQFKKRHFQFLFPLIFLFAFSGCGKKTSSLNVYELGAIGRIEGRVIGMDGKPLGNIRLTLDTLIVGFVNRSNYIQVDEFGDFAVNIPIFRGFRPLPADTVECCIMYYGRIGDSIRHAGTPILSLRPGEIRRGVVLDLRKGIRTLQINIVDEMGNPVANARTSLMVVYRGGGHGFSDAADPPLTRGHIETNVEGQTPLLHLSSDFYYKFIVWGDGDSYRMTELFRATEDMEDLVIQIKPRK